MTVYRCNLCVGFLAISLRILLNHIGRIHKNDPNFHILCGINSCPRTHKSFFSFRNHVVLKHKNQFDNNGVENHDARDNANANGNSNPNEGEELAEEAIINNDEDFDMEREQNTIQKCSAKCLLQFKDEGRVPQTVVNLFIKNSSEIVQNSIGILKSGVQHKLERAGLNIDDIPGLTELFGEDSLIANPFQGLEKEKQQYSYYKKNFGLVEPQEVVLARYHKKVRKRNLLVDRAKNDSAYYIPLLKSLQQLLNNDTVLEEIMNPHVRDDGLLFDFCDGDSFKLHPLFGTDQYALQLLLYYDELEVCNPLGSRANKHKLGPFYYTLGNIRPERRSHMNAIQLLALATSKQIKEYGIEPILQPFLDDIKELEKEYQENLEELLAISLVITLDLSSWEVLKRVQDHTDLVESVWVLEKK